MLFRIQVQGAFPPSGWRGSPAVCSTSEQAPTPRDAPNLRHTWGASVQHQKAWEKPSIGRKALLNSCAVTHAGFLAAGQPLVTLSEVLVAHHALLLGVNPQVPRPQIRFQEGEREKSESSSDGPTQADRFIRKVRKITGCQEGKLEKSCDLMEICREGSLEK